MYPNNITINQFGTDEQHICNDNISQLLNTMFTAINTMRNDVTITIDLYLTSWQQYYYLRVYDGVIVLVDTQLHYSNCKIAKFYNGTVKTYNKSAHYSPIINAIMIRMQSYYNTMVSEVK